MDFERSSGLLLHPTSFPSKYGIGDFGSYAYKFIDFLKKAKQSLWQILPLGPTSFGDSPYQSFSTFAGNFLLISPELLVKENYLKKEDLVKIPEFDDTTIDYGVTIEYKNSLYRKAYENFKLSATNEQKLAYNKFCTKNISWLEDYTLFVALKDYFINQRNIQEDNLEKNVDSNKESDTINNEDIKVFSNEENQESKIFNQEFETFKKAHSKILSGTIVNDYYFGAVWSTWPEDLVTRKPEALNEWKEKLSDEIKYYKFLQYEFLRQWNKLKDYANTNNIKIIGDIPIFVAYDSADTWANPDLFHLDTKGFPKVVAGVPPDYFSATGQLWGNPLYKWENHKKTEYKWWIDRIKETLKLVDIVRIDHFRGFDEYWEIPANEKTAINGKWKKGPGKDLFIAIKKALGKLPIIAEDLGIISDSVGKLRDYFDFPGMKILQFAFLEDDVKAENPYLPHNANKNSVIYSGTHDNNTTKGWYKEISDIEKDIIRRYMNISGENISWDFIRLAYSTVCNMAIVTMQDIMNLDSDCRMNTPGEASNNWQWRYTQDMLLDEYTERLAYLSKLFGR